MKRLLPEPGFLHHGLFCLLLLIVLVLAIDSARAEDANKGTPLKLTVDGCWWPPPLNKPAWIYVKNLEKWAHQPGYDLSRFTLCINGTPVKDSPPPFLKINDKGEAYLLFQVNPTSDYKETWKYWVGDQLWWPKETVALTVLDGNVPLEGSAKVHIPINRPWLYIFLVLVVAAIILFAWWAHKSDVIRDAGDQPKGTDKYGRPNRKPYSLGRTQMAFWFFVVVASFVFIWMLTSDLASLTPSVLTLIGISAATGLGSATVDSSKRTNQENLLRSLEKKKMEDQLDADKLHSQIKSFSTTLNAVPASRDLEQQRAAIAHKQGELAAKEKEITESTLKIQKVQATLEPVPSKGFLNDLLHDEGGVSFHRFQILAWTIVLGAIFISKVAESLLMPDFNPTLLALMGISGGTYIGFKLPAQQG
jgi:hypothetical protein